MVIVMVGEENDSHLAHVRAGLRQAPRHAVAGVHNVVGAVYGKEMGRLRPTRCQRRAARGTEGDQ
jgi:hypothetical protein